MDKKQSFFSQILKSFKRLFIRLFGFGKQKRKLDVLEEETLMSPSKIIVRNFLRNKLALLGLAGLTFMILFTFVLGMFIPYNEFYYDGTQQHLPPNISYLKYPKQLEKEGVRIITSGSSFSIAVSNEGNLYAWGSNVHNIKKQVLEVWKKDAAYIKDVAAGNNHAIALVEREVEHVWRDFIVLNFEKDRVGTQTAEDGSVWYSANQQPDDEIGDNGEYYVNIETKQIFIKNNDTWEVLFDLTGKTEVTFKSQKMYLAETTPEDSFGIDGEYYLNTQVLKNPTTHNGWIIYQKKAKDVEQELLFAGLNSHNQAEIPTFERDENGNYDPNLRARLEREAIARYFDSEYFIHRYKTKRLQPYIEMDVEFTDDTKTAVNISYEILDRDEVILPNSVFILYGTKSASHSVLLKTDKATKTAPVDLSALPDDDGFYRGSLTISGLTPDKNYQFTLGYGVNSIAADGTEKPQTNYIRAHVLKTGGDGVADPSFLYVLGEINSISQSFVYLPIVNIKNDPIVRVLANQDITSILTESGKLFTWGSTDSDDNYYGNTIQNDVPIVDIINSRSHIVVLRSDNSLEIYGPTSNAISLNLGEKYPFFRLSREDRHIAVMDEVNRLNNEIAKLDVNSPNYQKDLADLQAKIKLAEEQDVEIVKIAATTQNVLLLTADNELLIWGNQVANVVHFPETIEKGKIKTIYSGLEHFIVLTTDGKVIAWGKNDLNQLNVPKNIKPVEKIFVNRFQNYAITVDGEIEAWGNTGYLFGTDSQGRPLLHRIIMGGRVSMIVGIIAVAISLVIGVIVGLVAGFYGGWVDNILMRFAEVVSSFPFLPLAITLSSIIGNKMEPDMKMYLIMVILGVLSWPGLARLVRGQILSEREKDFVTAARALGIKEKHIITRHILPNVINIIIVNATLGYAGNLLTEAGLSFLGFGVQPPQPSWGNLLTAAQNLTTIQYYWWEWILPAVFIVITALSINLIGDGLREAMDPKANER